MKSLERKKRGDLLKFSIIDNSKFFKDELKNKIPVALEAIGLAAEGHAKAICPVDTGRLRNSISHDKDDEAAYIGTNVEYAPYVELGTSRGKAQPYLRPAVADHVDEYKRIAENCLKE